MLEKNGRNQEKEHEGHWKTKMERCKWYVKEWRATLHIYSYASKNHIEENVNLSYSANLLCTSTWTNISSIRLISIWSESSWYAYMDVGWSDPIRVFKWWYFIRSLTALRCAMLTSKKEEGFSFFILILLTIDILSNPQLFQLPTNKHFATTVLFTWFEHVQQQYTLGHDGNACLDVY